MNLYSAFSALNSFEGDPVERLGRKTLLQFIALDYCIYKQIEILISNFSPDLQKELLNNPYKFTSKMIHELNPNTIEGLRNESGGTSVRSKLINAFMHYNISICLQQIICYVLINTPRVVDLQKVDVEDTDGTSESYATQDTIDEEVIKYYRDIRDNKVKEELESANLGRPIDGKFEDILVTIVQSLGDFSNQDIENILQENKNIIPEERKREYDLIEDIFENENPTYEEMESNAGFKNVFDNMSKFLPQDISGIFNSTLFYSILDYWGKLFSEAQPEIINTLATKLPSIKERFVTSTTDSTTQQEFRYKSLKLLSDFLDKSIKPIRINQLSNVSSNPSAANCLVILRSLRVLDLKSKILNSSLAKLKQELKAYVEVLNDHLQGDNATTMKSFTDKAIDTKDNLDKLINEFFTLIKDKQYVTNNKTTVDAKNNLEEMKNFKISTKNKIDPKALQLHIDQINNAIPSSDRLADEVSNLFVVENDQTGRLNFLYTCTWLLSQDKELNILFDFAFRHTTSTEFDSIQDKVNSASMFPGSLDYGKEARTGSATLIDLDLENDRRKISIKEEKLKRAGDLEKVLDKDGVKWLI